MTNLSDTIIGEIRKYNTSVMEKIDKAAIELDKKMKAEVRADTPLGKSEKGQHLANQWQTKAYGATGRKVGKREFNGALYVVRAKKKWQLVHLLNFPHRVVSHGRDTGFVAQPVMNMKAIENRYQEQLEQKIKEIIDNG